MSDCGLVKNVHGVSGATSRRTVHIQRSTGKRGVGTGLIDKGERTRHVGNRGNVRDGPASGCLLNIHGNHARDALDREDAPMGLPRYAETRDMELRPLDGARHMERAGIVADHDGRS